MNEIEEFMEAAFNKDADRVQALIKKNREYVNMRNKDDMTALMVAAVVNAADVARVLLKAGADVNARNNDGMTALMCTGIDNATDVARLLIDAGADVNPRCNGRSALKMAEEEGSEDVARILRAAGAK